MYVWTSNKCHFFIGLIDWYAKKKRTFSNLKKKKKKVSYNIFSLPPIFIRAALSSSKWFSLSMGLFYLITTSNRKLIKQPHTWHHWRLSYHIYSLYLQKLLQHCSAPIYDKHLPSIPWSSWPSLSLGKKWVMWHGICIYFFSYLTKITRNDLQTKTIQRN